LPSTVADLEAQRIVQRSITLLDEVEQVLLKLFEESEFRRHREALEPEDTVEGSIQDDDTISAQMIRKKAEEMGLMQVVNAKLHDIRLKLRGAERRVNISRKQRAAASA